MILGKKAGEKILSIWWFAVLVFIAAGILSGVFMFYNLEGDVRLLHAKILNEKVFDCIEENGFLVDGWMSADRGLAKKMFREKCKFRASPDVYIRLTIGNSPQELVFGGLSMKEDCKLRLDGKTKLSKYFPQCYEEKRNLIYFKSGERKIIDVEVLVGIKSLGERTGKLK